MSNATTRRFVVLSQSVNTSDDVFNNQIGEEAKKAGNKEVSDFINDVQLFNSVTQVLHKRYTNKGVLHNL
jgi:ubiquinone biosynthesis protein UbiJ